MLYIVMLPVKADKVRNVAVVQAEGFADVMEVLKLPQGWMSWVSLTDIELESVMQGKHHYHTMFLQKERY